MQSPFLNTLDTGETVVLGALSPASPRAHPMHPLLMRSQSVSRHRDRQSACKGAPATKERQAESTLKTRQKSCFAWPVHVSSDASTIRQTARPVHHARMAPRPFTSSVVRISRKHLGLAPAARPDQPTRAQRPTNHQSPNSRGALHKFSTTPATPSTPRCHV